jgi:hypothetical protein
MGDDAREIARADVWRRFDAGEIGAAEVEARLRRIDRAVDDDTVAGAASGTLPITSRLSRRSLALIGALGVIVVGLGVAAVVTGVGEDELGAGGGQTVGTGEVGAPTDGGVGVIVGGPAVDPVAPPPFVGPGCEALDDLTAAQEASGVDVTQQPTNPVLLTDPAFVPEGWEFGDDYSVTPGGESDIAMSTAAGTPGPIEIAARDLDGPRRITMRTFVYEDHDTAVAASSSAPMTSLCSFNGRLVEDPSGNGLFTVVLTDAPIPPAAFSGWLRGDRRFTVMVEAASTEEADLDAAAAAAGEIAAAELAAALGTTAAGGGVTETSVGGTRDTIPPG